MDHESCIVRLSKLSCGKPLRHKLSVSEICLRADVSRKIFMEISDKQAFFIVEYLFNSMPSSRPSGSMLFSAPSDLNHMWEERYAIGSTKEYTPKKEYYLNLAQTVDALNSVREHCHERALANGTESCFPPENEPASRGIRLSYLLLLCRFAGHVLKWNGSIVVIAFPRPRLSLLRGCRRVFEQAGWYGIEGIRFIMCYACNPSCGLCNEARHFLVTCPVCVVLPLFCCGAKSTLLAFKLSPPPD